MLDNLFGLIRKTNNQQYNLQNQELKGSWSVKVNDTKHAAESFVWPEPLWF